MAQTVYTIDVTALAPSGGVELYDLGFRVPVPKYSNPPTNTVLTVGFDLSAVGLIAADLQSSRMLTTTLEAGYILLRADGDVIESQDAVALKDMPDLLQVYETVKEPTGFENRTDSTISFVDGTRTFTLQPAVDQFVVYAKGVRLVVDTPLSVVLPNATALYFLYLSDSSTLSYVVGFNLTLLREYVIVAALYFNATTGRGEFLTEERHGLTMDWATHSHLHLAFGTRYYNGLGAAYTLVGSGALDAEAQIAIGGGTIADEDIVTLIIDDPSPSAPFEQILSPIAQLPVVYKLGAGAGAWQKDVPTNFPVKVSGGRVQYNSNSGGWALTDVPDGSFVAYWVFAVPDLASPVLAFMGSRTDLTLSDAENNNAYSTVNFGDLPANEHKILYRLIFECNAAFANGAKCVLRSVSDLRGSIDSSLTSFPATSSNSHSLLTELDADTHLQYHNDARGDVRYYTKAQANANYQPLSSRLTAFAALASNGLVVQTAPNTFTSRSVVAGSSKVQVANGDGVLANPSIDVNEANLSIAQSQIPNLTSDLGARELVANKSTDTNLGTSDTAYPSQRAVKIYIDTAVSGLLDDRGNYDASTNLYPTTGGSGPAGAVRKGDLWFISVAGVLGGVQVSIGDQLRALADDPAQVSANWALAEANLGYVPENSTNKSNDPTLSANSATLYPTQQAVKTYADTKVAANGTIVPSTRTKVTYDAKGLVTAGADATTADIADSAGRRYVVDGDLTKLANLSGVNSGDQTIALSGDVAGSGTGPITTTIQANAVNDAKIAAHTSTKISITAKPQLNNQIVYADQANTYSDADQIFRSGRLQVRNPANSFSYLLLGSAIGANRNLTLPPITQDATLAIVPQVVQVNPANPTGTNSLAALMMGLAVAFTPRTGGRIKITVEGLYGATNAGSNVNISLRTGTGVAPSNGGAAAGAVQGASPTYFVASANEFIPFTLMRYVPSLTIGVAIWIDLSLARVATNGTVSVTTLTITIEEQ